MSYLLARNYVDGGYMDLGPEHIPAELKSRKRVRVEELDDEGNVMETYLLDDTDNGVVLSALIAYKGNLWLANGDALSSFSDEELSMIKELSWRYDFYPTESQILEWEKFFSIHGSQKIKMALDMSDYYGMQGAPYFMTHAKHPLAMKHFSFEEALSFIEERTGIYYAVDNTGVKKWDFIDRPTKKQAQYQRRKNGNRIVFLSFSDWKEHAVKEDELGN